MEQEEGQEGGEGTASSVWVTPAHVEDGKQRSPPSVCVSDTEMVTGQFSRQQSGAVHGGCSEAAFQ